MKIFRAEEDLGVSPLSAFRACAGAVCFTMRAARPSVSPRGRQFLPPGRGCAAPQTARAQAPLRRFPLLRQGRPPNAAERPYTPVTGPPIYIDTRNAQKVAPVLHFFKKIFVPLWMRTKIFRAAWNWDNIFRVSVGWDRNGEKRAARPPGRQGKNGEKAHGGLPGAWIKTERKRAVGNGQNGARGPRAAKRAARERRAMENAPQSGAGADGATWDGSAGFQPAGRAKAQKSAGSLRRFWVGSFAPAPCRSAP